MKKIMLIVTFILCMLITESTFAENVKIEEIIVTGTSTGMPRSVIPASVTVITEKDIKETGISNVSDLLRKVPGLDVVQPGGTGKTSSVFIRGANSSHTLVLIDGIRVNSPTTGRFDFADLSIDSIERIEIIRSPMSTLYGSEAMGGVIQIFTKRGTLTTGSVAFEAGSFGTTKESVSTGIKRDFYDINLSASRLDTEGFSTIAAGSENDSYENTTVSSKIGFHRAGRSIGITAQLTEAQTEIDGYDYITYAASDDLNNRTDRRLGLFGINMVSSHSNNWENNLSVSRTKERIEGLDEDPIADNRGNINTSITTGDWHINIRSSDDDKLTIGYEWQKQDGEVDSFYGVYSKSLTNNAIYIQDNRKLNQSALLLAAVRWDESSLYESALTYRVGVSLNQTNELKWHAQYGTGFHGPSLNDLFWPGYSNPDLKPEKNTGWEIGLEEMILNSALFSLTYYSNDFTNLISPELMQNIDKAVSNGLETNLDWDLSSAIHLNGNYTYNETEDKKTNKYLLRRPLNKYGVTFTMKPSGHTILGIKYLYTGERLDVGSETLKAYSKVDIFASYKLRKNTELYGRIENLLDEDYEEAKGYGTAGFSTYWGIRISL